MNDNQTERQRVQSALNALEECSPAIGEWKTALENDQLAEAQQHLGAAIVTAEGAQKGAEADQRALHEDTPHIARALLSLGEVTQIGANTSADDHLACINSAARHLGVAGNATVDTEIIKYIEERILAARTETDNSQVSLAACSRIVAEATPPSVATINSKLDAARQEVRQLPFNSQLQLCLAYMQNARQLSLEPANTLSTSLHQSSVVNHFTPRITSDLAKELAESIAQRYKHLGTADTGRKEAIVEVDILRAFLNSKLGEVNRSHEAIQATYLTVSQAAQVAVEHTNLVSAANHASISIIGRTWRHLGSAKDDLSRRQNGLSELERDRNQVVYYLSSGLVQDIGHAATALREYAATLPE